MLPARAQQTLCVGSDRPYCLLCQTLGPSQLLSSTVPVRKQLWTVSPEWPSPCFDETSCKAGRTWPAGRAPGDRPGQAADGRVALGTRLPPVKPCLVDAVFWFLSITGSVWAGESCWRQPCHLSSPENTLLQGTQQNLPEGSIYTGLPRCLTSWPSGENA